MDLPPLRRSFFQRLLGQCATSPPADEDCWSHEGDEVVVDLSRAPELAPVYGAIRLESRALPERILLIHTDSGYLALRNRCTHAGRRLDPMPGARRVQCCSLGKSTYDYEGQCISGAARKTAVAYPATVDDGKVVISLKPSL